MKPSAISIFGIVLVSLFAATSCTDNSAVQKATKLEEQNKTLLARLEEDQKQRQALDKSLTELRQQVEQAQQATKQAAASRLEEDQKQQQATKQAAASRLEEDQKQRQATKQSDRERWKALIGKIIVMLDRVKNQQTRIIEARNQSELAAEETRVKSIAQEQESQALLLVVELKAQNFPNADKLESLVKGFTKDYIWFTTYQSLITASPVGGDAFKESKNKYMELYLNQHSMIQILEY